MNPVLAQFNQPGPGGPGAAQPDPAALAGMLACYAVVIVVAIVLQVLFLLTVSRCLREIRPRNRQMSPGQVWLCLIPIFGFVWTIITVIRLADSLKDEYDDRGLRPDGDFGKGIGIAYVVTSIFCGPIGLILWIMYWVKVAGYRKRLAEDAGYEDEEDDYDDEDDRPRGRGRAADEDDEDDDRPRRRRDEDDDDEDDRPRRRR